MDARLKGNLFKRVKEQYDLRQIIHMEDQTSHGSYNRGRCPFHPDTNPSCLVFKDSWVCLSSNCHHPRGSIIDYEAHQKGCSSPSGSQLVEIAEGLLSNRMFDYVGMEQQGRVKRPKKVPAPDVIPLNERAARLYHRMLTAEAVTYLVDRGLEWETIESYCLGFNGSAIVIPVWGRDNLELLTFRFRTIVGEGPRYYGIRRHNQSFLFNSAMAERATVYNFSKLYVFYGEFDAILACQCGIPAISPTNGCKAFWPEWLRGFEGQIVFVPDRGEADVALRDAYRVGIRGVTLSLPFGVEEGGKDFTTQYLFARSKDGGLDKLFSYYSRRRFHDENI